MSNDIALKELGRIEYIPEDGILCNRCKFYEVCPYDYVCRALDDLLIFEENGVL